MRNPRVNYIIVGGFIAAMLVAAVMSMAVVAGRTGSSEPYHLVMDNVTDVKFGTQVRYEGYPVGQVEGIEPFAENGRMKFRIDVSVQAGWQFPADSLARIGNSSFLSAKTIDITSGESQRTIEVGGRIPSAPPADIFAVMAQVAADVSDLSQSHIKPMIEQVSGMTERLGGRVEADLAQVFDRLKILLDRTDTSVAAIQSLLSDDNVRSLEAMIQDSEVISAQLRETTEVAARLTSEISEHLNGNRRSVKSAIGNVDYTVASVADNIDSILHNLDAASRNMNEFSRLIRQNPGLLLGGAAAEEVSGSEAYSAGVPQ